MFADFSKLQKVYMLFCGLVVAFALCWLTFVYMEYRVVNMQWNEKYGDMSPSEIWDIPTWNWNPVFNKLDGGNNG